MILSATKQLDHYRKMFSRLVHIARSHPTAQLQDVVVIAFDEVTGITRLEVKKPVNKETDGTEKEAAVDV